MLNSEISWVIQLNIIEDKPLFSLVSGEDCIPLKVDEKLVFFLSPEELGNRYGAIYNINANIPFTVFDIPKAVLFLEKKKTDKNSNILDTINYLDDLLIAIVAEIPDKYRNPLYEIADFLTFDRNLAKFFKNSSVTRTEVIEAIQWMVGVVQKNCKIIQLPVT